MTENTNTLNTIKTRITDGATDVAIFLITPFASLYFRTAEKAKEKGWL